MSETERKRQKGEFDLRNNRATLLIMVAVPLIISLVLVATAVVFGRPVDSAQVSSDAPVAESVHLTGGGLQAPEANNRYPNVIVPTQFSPQASAPNEGYDLSELVISPERALEIGLVGTYSVW